MLRRTLAFATLVSTFLLLLFFALGNPAKSLFASTLQQADSSDEGMALSQPMTVTVRQQIPFTLTLVTTQVITQGETVTDTVTEPVTQTTVITFEVETEVVISSTGVITTPLSVKLRSTQIPTSEFPVKSSLVVVRNLLAQLGVELPPLPEPSDALTTTESLTGTESITGTESLTTTESITDSTEVTATEDLTTTGELTATETLTGTEALSETAEITETVVPTPTEEVATTEPANSNATLTALSNIRSDTNLEATSIITQVAAGTPISVVAQSADQSWLLLDSGYWVSVLVVDAVPTGLSTATDEQIAALREASAALVETPAAPTIEATPTPTGEVSGEITTTVEATATVEATPTEEPTVAPTLEPTIEPTIEPTVEATATTPSGPTVTVDANLRAGPGTEFEVLGGTVTGQALTIVGRNADGSWYRLDNGGWLLGRLVANPPANEAVPVVNNDGSPVTAPLPEPTASEEVFLLPTPTPTP